MSVNIGGDILSSSGYTLNSQIVNDPKIVTDGLVYWIDPGNLYSYAGYNEDYYDCYDEADPEPNRGCKYYSSDPGCYRCGDVLLDMSGYGNDARKISPLITVGYSDIGAYIDFPGTTSCYLSASRANYLELEYNRPSDTGEITIQAWIRPTSFTQQGNIVNCGFNTGYRCRITSGGDLWFYVSGNNISGGAVTLNVWTLVTFTGDANGLEQFVNMTSGASNGTAFNPSSKSYLLIGTYNSTSEQFVGQMGPVMIYDRVLSYEERLHNYRVGLKRYSNDTIVVPTPSITPTPSATPAPSVTPTPTPTYPAVLTSRGSITVTSSSSTFYDGYARYNHTPHSSPNIITMTFNYDISAYAFSSYADVTLFYRKNGGSWQFVDNVVASTFSSSVTTSGSFSVTLVDYNDTVDVRALHYAYNPGPDQTYSSVITTGGSVTSGSGSVSATSPTEYAVYL